MASKQQHQQTHVDNIVNERRLRPIYGKFFHFRFASSFSPLILQFFNTAWTTLFATRSCICSCTFFAAYPLGNTRLCNVLLLLLMFQTDLTMGIIRRPSRRRIKSWRSILKTNALAFWRHLPYWDLAKRTNAKVSLTKFALKYPVRIQRFKPWVSVTEKVTNVIYTLILYIHTILFHSKQIF